MAKSKRSAKDSSGKGHSKGKAGNKDGRGSLSHDATTTPSSSNSGNRPRSTTTSTRYVRVFPLDWTSAFEYASNLVLLLVVALLLGYSVGVGWIGITTADWRWQIAQGIRSSTTYQLITFQPGKWQQVSAQSLRDIA